MGSNPVGESTHSSVPCNLVRLDAHRARSRSARGDAVHERYIRAVSDISKALVDALAGDRIERAEGIVATLAWASWGVGAVAANEPPGGRAG